MKIRGLFKGNQERNFCWRFLWNSSYNGVLWRVWKDWLEWEISVKSLQKDPRRASPEGASPVGASPVGLLPLGLLRCAQSSRFSSYDPRNMRSLDPTNPRITCFSSAQSSLLSLSLIKSWAKSTSSALAHSTSSDSSIASLILQASFDSSIASSSFQNLPCTLCFIGTWFHELEYLLILV